MNETWFTVNGWKVVHRNVGILCEDSLGLGLTSFIEEKLGEKGWSSLLLAELPVEPQGSLQPSHHRFQNVSSFPITQTVLG